MDLLGSIMSKMEKPPTTLTPLQREARKKQMEHAKKLKEREKEKIRNFKKELEVLVGEFVNNDTESKKTLPTMDELQRSIVHEVADLAGVVCHSFGTENVDRHLVIFKKDYEILPEELAALRRGEHFDPILHKQQQFERDLQRRLDEQKLGCQSVPVDGATARRCSARHQVAAPAFVEKRRRFIGDAQTAEPLAPASSLNVQFGVVSSHLKTDKRSIEETLADIRAKKLRAENEQDS